MGIKKVFTCDCCKQEIDGHYIPPIFPNLVGDFKNTFYKIPGYTIYLEDSAYRADDLMICKECLNDIINEINKRKNIQFDLEIE